MGQCQSEEMRQQLQITAMIDKEIKKEKRNRKKIKLLLIGPGECGKSTVLKQMQIIHHEGLSDPKELSIHAPAIFSTVIDSMAVILNFMRSAEIPLEDPEREVQMTSVLLLSEETEEKRKPFSFDTYSAVNELLKDNGIKVALLRKSNFQLDDSAEYFLDSLERLNNTNYVPTRDDVLRVRVPTNGISEVNFEMKDFNFRVFDVGGQRSERRKWIHVFDDANAIIFLIALSEYDKVLREDETSNRMADAMTLFEFISNNNYFIDTMIILFLNKKDLFEQKIQKVPIQSAFPLYEGEQEYEPCVAYIRQQFLYLNENREREIKTHETCATDTKQVTVVMNACVEKIVKQMIEDSGVE